VLQEGVSLPFCSVLQCVAVCYGVRSGACCSVIQCVAACCIWRRVWVFHSLVCCSLLQCVLRCVLQCTQCIAAGIRYEFAIL